MLLVAAATLVPPGEGFSPVVGAARRDGAGVFPHTPLALGARRRGACRGFSGRVVGARAPCGERRAHSKARAAGALGLVGDERGAGWEEGGDAKVALNEVCVPREGGAPRMC